MDSFFGISRRRFPGALSEQLMETDRSSDDGIRGFTLIEEIGEGGMGIVYRAEQIEPVKRTVAVKVIKQGLDTREVVARFDAERQALAMMDHSGIARVLDAGATEKGRPYFAMELVSGVPITDYCERHRLSTRQRLELFVDICRAVQHAHQKGIIHRDLKPSNILVSAQDGVMQPKIIDFGIAKATSGKDTLTDKTLFTSFNQVLGTPAYMSPEQLEVSGLDLDTRTDIYALGVILYELLTKLLPFDPDRLETASNAELERILWEEEPPRPSKRLASHTELHAAASEQQVAAKKLCVDLRGELDWIVLKCLEKDRARRYPSAGDLAEDVRRFLRNEPVQASPPSRLYLTKKFIQRHAFGLTALAAVLLVLAAGTAISTWQALRARSAESVAQVERRNAEASAQRATEESALAKARLANTDAMLQFILEDIFGQAAPDSQPNRNIKLRTVLDSAALEVEERFKDQRDINAVMQHNLGKVYLGLGLYDQAKAHLDRSAELMADVAADMNGVERQTAERHLISTKEQLGVLALRTRDFDTALRLLEDVFEKRQGMEDEDPSNMLFTKFNLGIVYSDLLRDDEAIALLEECLEESMRIHSENDSQTLLMATLLGSLHHRNGREEQARHYHEMANRWSRNEEIVHEGSPDHLDSLNNRAVGHMELQEFDKALPLLERSLELSRTSLGPRHPSTLSTVHNLASVYVLTKQPEKAAPFYEEAWKGESANRGEGSDLALEGLRNFALTLLSSGDYEKGVEHLERLFATARRHHGDSHAQVEWAYRELVRAAEKLDDPEISGKAHRAITGETPWPEARTRVLLPRKSLWFYRDLGSLSDDWVTTPLTDMEWKRGRAPLGYGEESLQTRVAYGKDAQAKHITTYFRAEFQLDRHDDYEAFRLLLRRDDGAVVYINGREVARSALPAGPVNGETPALESVNALSEQLYYAFEIDPTALRDGPNQIAAEVHQGKPDSSDLIFDLELQGLRKGP